MLASVRVGFQSLSTNPLRTLLSTLGVIMGVAALVAVLALGDGMEKFARRQVVSTTSLQAVAIAPLTGRTVDGVFIPDTIVPMLGLADAAAVGAMPGVQSVQLGVDGTALVTVPGAPGAGVGEPHATQVIATLANARRNLDLRLSAGRWFSDDEVRDSARVVVVSGKLAKVLSPANPTALVGGTVQLQGTTFQVIGVGWPAGGVMPAMAWVPFTAAGMAMAPARAPRPPVMAAIAATIEEVPTVKAQVERWLAAQHPEWRGRVQVRTDEARAKQAKQGIFLFKLFMGAITGISLLVGGIGIMNVLLAAVAERTREIGIRKATGARQRDILAQFLAESVAITGLGSAIGFAVGLTGALGITAVMRRMAEMPIYAAFAWSTLVVAAVAAVVVGLAFGVYPAVRAARLSPVEAIHYE
jgi:putative ABC transport system permease protein